MSSVLCLQGLPRACKRCLAGMKEVSWAVGKPGRTKLVLLAPNIQIPSQDCVLMQQVLLLVHKCVDANVPVIMGPTRKHLGMAFCSSGAPSAHPLSCCGRCRVSIMIHRGRPATAALQRVNTKQQVVEPCGVICTPSIANVPSRWLLLFSAARVVFNAQRARVRLPQNNAHAT
jgi:ribosomal protein L7Ae-like RNA K-turn-binding protein